MSDRKILLNFGIWLFFGLLTIFVGISDVFGADETFWSSAYLGRLGDTHTYEQTFEIRNNSNNLLLVNDGLSNFWPLWIGGYGHKTGNWEANKVYYLRFKLTYPSNTLLDWKRLMQYGKMGIHFEGVNVNYCTLENNTNTYSNWVCEFTVPNPNGSYYEFNVNFYDLNFLGLDFTPIYSYEYTQVFIDFILSSQTDKNGQIVEQNEIIIGQNAQIIDNLNELNDNVKESEKTNKNIFEKIKDIFNWLTNDDDADTSALNDVAGWLPPGPLDSIINLPLTMLNSINNKLSGTCNPLNVDLPYVNKNVEIPCLSTIFNQITGVNGLWTWVGLISSVLILYNYLINLYKYYDRLTTLQANYISDWGGV